jgi:membrane associated rhomboid family serine protease
VGIHDRTYMREEGGWRRHDIRSWTTRFTILAVVAVLVMESTRAWTTFPLAPRLVLDADWFAERRFWAPLTYPLATRLGLGLVFGLFAFWLLGHMAETRMGRARFPAFVVVAVLAGAAVHLASLEIPALGSALHDRADGWGVVTTACLFHVAAREPRLRIELGFFGMPAWAFAALWIGVDVLVQTRAIRGLDAQLWVLGGRAT